MDEFVNLSLEGYNDLKLTEEKYALLVEKAKYVYIETRFALGVFCGEGFYTKDEAILKLQDSQKRIIKKYQTDIENKEAKIKELAIDNQDLKERLNKMIKTVQNLPKEKGQIFWKKWFKNDNK